VRIEQYIRRNYYDPRLGLYRLRLQGPAADQRDLVAQLDQVNAYMLLLSRLLPLPYQAQWRAELAQIAQIIRGRFYDARSAMFVGTLAAPKAQAACIFDRVDTDFGHTVKAYWMLYLSGRVLHDGGLEKFAAARVPGLLRRAYLGDSGSWATQPTCDGRDGGLNRTSTWWMSAELDQSALTFGLTNPHLLSYIPTTYRFWLQHMVDHRHGEVWNELTLPELTPRLPKVDQWKNGYHTAEHAMVGYITAAALRSQPLVLYYAFENCRLPAVVEPYFFDGSVTAHSASRLPELPGLCRMRLTFVDIH
jgi:mannose/cellobiose epimerase-like protein (N-acyl-D-glucosamine 2-epimerase family)